MNTPQNLNNIINNNFNNQTNNHHHHNNDNNNQTNINNQTNNHHQSNNHHHSNNNNNNNNNDNKEIKIPSLILQSENQDLSYNNKEIEKCFEESEISIDRINKKINIDKNKIKTNFNVLKNFIDFDRNHQNYLDEEYENSRYQDISTYTYNKVKLPSNNYINASYIDLPSKKFFIATQGPLPHTIDHFWEMIWENDVKYIVMLCELKEGGREKCAEYWNQNNSKKFKIEVKKKQKKK